MTGKIDYPLLKRTMEIKLNDEDRMVIEDVIADIEEIKKQKHIPELEEKKICRKCAYYDLCFI